MLLSHLKRFDKKVGRNCDKKVPRNWPVDLPMNAERSVNELTGNKHPQTLPPKSPKQSTTTICCPLRKEDTKGFAVPGAKFEENCVLLPTLQKTLKKQQRSKSPEIAIGTESLKPLP